MAGQRAQWGSRLGFILAAAGSAVGLGNIWKMCIARVGLPIPSACSEGWV